MRETWAKEYGPKQRRSSRSTMVRSQSRRWRSGLQPAGTGARGSAPHIAVPEAVGLSRDVGHDGRGHRAERRAAEGGHDADHVEAEADELNHCGVRPVDGLGVGGEEARVETSGGLEDGGGHARRCTWRTAP
eukprot:7390182-Prymnesium_polylepis.1